MAHFILQSDSDCLDIEFHIIRDLLHKNRYAHDYTLATTKELSAIAKKNDVPIGDITFVTKYLQEQHGISKMLPIEIPEYLRTNEFLKRDYRFVKAKELPRYGNWFIKDVDTLKNFTYCGQLEYLGLDEMFGSYKNENDFHFQNAAETTFLVSSVFDIKSEYRVYVIDGKIEAICNYNGAPTVFPDISLVKKAVAKINCNEPYLKSYTLDIMVGNEGTAIIEVHNFVAVGLYGTLWGDNILNAYRQGIDYAIRTNYDIE